MQKLQITRKLEKCEQSTILAREQTLFTIRIKTIPRESDLVNARHSNRVTARFLPRFFTRSPRVLIPRLRVNNRSPPRVVGCRVLFSAFSVSTGLTGHGCSRCVEKRVARLKTVRVMGEHLQVVFVPPLTPRAFPRFRELLC